MGFCIQWLNRGCRANSRGGGVVKPEYIPILLEFTKGGRMIRPSRSKQDDWQVPPAPDPVAGPVVNDFVR